MIFIHRTGYFQAIDINSSRPLIYIYDKIESSAVILNLLPITIIGNSLTENSLLFYYKQGNNETIPPQVPNQLPPIRPLLIIHYLYNLYLPFKSVRIFLLVVIFSASYQQSKFLFKIYPRTQSSNSTPVHPE